MAITIQPLTPSNYSGYAVTDVQYADGGGYIPIYLSRDLKTLYARGAGAIGVYPEQVPRTVLARSTDDGATWQVIRTFVGEAMQSLAETDDGEMLVSTITTFSSNAGPSKLYRSTGWNADAINCPLALVLTTVSGELRNSWSLRDMSFGPNGLIFVSEYGQQTSSGQPLETYTVGARRIFVSADHGRTWNQMYDLYKDPAWVTSSGQSVNGPGGVHVHCIAYDRDDDRLYTATGDNVGAGDDIAGVGNMQLGYIDNASTYARANAGVYPAMTWLPNPSYYDGSGSQAAQFTTIYITPTAVIVGADVLVYSLLVYPKLGYRNLGAPIPAFTWTDDRVSNTINRNYSHPYVDTPMLVSEAMSSTQGKYGAFVSLRVGSEFGYRWQDVWVDTTTPVSQAWANALAVTAGQFVQASGSANRLYQVVTGGALGAAAPSDATGNPFANGTATLRYIGLTQMYLDAVFGPTASGKLVAAYQNYINASNVDGRTATTRWTAKLVAPKT